MIRVTLLCMQPFTIPDLCVPSPSHVCMGKACAQLWRQSFNYVASLMDEQGEGLLGIELHSVVICVLQCQRLSSPVIQTQVLPYHMTP